jgi:hypothetical protein
MKGGLLGRCPRGRLRVRQFRGHTACRRLGRLRAWARGDRVTHAPNSSSSFVLAAAQKLHDGRGTNGASAQPVLLISRVTLLCGSLPRVVLGAVLRVEVLSEPHVFLLVVAAVLASLGASLAAGLSGHHLNPETQSRRDRLWRLLTDSRRP